MLDRPSIQSCVLMLSTLVGASSAQIVPLPVLASPEGAYSEQLTGRYAPRTDLPNWLHTPRWCTRDAPRYVEGGTAKMITDFADRGADTVRLGTYWGGLAMFASDVSPRVSSLKPGVNPLAEAMGTVRSRAMHLMAYINPNAYREQNPLYGTAAIRKADGAVWDIRAYGIEGTRYACSNHPAFADFYRNAIAELVTTYDVDGIYVDGLSPHVCYCEHCRTKFAQDTGRPLPAGLESLGPLSVLWEMTSDWQPLGDPADPEHQLYSRWLMKCLADLTRLFAEEARRAKPTAVVVFHTWPKPDSIRWYAGTLNEIYARKPWRYTLWKRAEFSNWGDAFSVPSLVNIYLRQHAWGSEKRTITGEVEARHLFWQALANGAYPNAWGHLGMELPFDLMRDHADLFDFPSTFPTRFLALPRPFFLSARHRTVAEKTAIPLRPGAGNCLRIWEREPNGRIDLLCLRADGKAPSDEEFTQGGTPGAGHVVYLKAAEFAPDRSVLAHGDRSWQVHQDPEALSGSCLTSGGHGLEKAPRLPLEYDLPELESTGAWMLWARVIFPNTGADSFFWQVSGDGGASWRPERPADGCAVGWEQPSEYAWVKARVTGLRGPGERSARFLSPPSGAYAGLLHAGLPVKQMHPNHLNARSLSGFSILVLANEVCMSDAQCAAVRAFVRGGGGLVASHETSRYDEAGRRRPDFGLGDVFGVSTRGRVQPSGTARLVLTDGAPLAVPDSGMPVREEVVEVVPHGRATIAASIGAPGAEATLPGAVLNTFGAGRVVYFAGRHDAEYAFHGGLHHFPALIGSAVRHVAPAGSVPARVAESPSPVGLTCFDQPSRNRRILHLVAYNADRTEAYEELPPIPNVRLRIAVPEGAHVEGIRAVRAERALVPHADGPRNVTVVLPVLNEYEILVLTWR